MFVVLLFALSVSEQFAGITYGCVATGQNAKVCEDMKKAYNDPNMINMLEEQMTKLLGEKVTVKINVETYTDAKKAASFPSKVAQTSLTAMLMSFISIPFDSPIDLTKLKTECFFSAMAYDFSLSTSLITINEEKLKKRTIKMLLAKSNEEKAKRALKLKDVFFNQTHSKGLKSLIGELYVKAPASCSSKVYMLTIFAENMSFVGNCEVNLYYITGVNIKEDSGLIKSPYLICDIDAFRLRPKLKASAPLNDVAFIDFNGMLKYCLFGEDGWRIGYSPYILQEIEKEFIGGKLSIIQMNIDMELTIKTGTITALDFNISASAEYISTGGGKSSKALKSSHSVRFSGPWNALTNKPTIILEATDPNTISVANQPDTVNLQKIKYEPKIKPKKKKPNIGLIVGVTIGVVAVIAIIAGVCVYFFVYKKKKVAGGMRP